MLPVRGGGKNIPHRGNSMGEDADAKENKLSWRA